MEDLEQEDPGQDDDKIKNLFKTMDNQNKERSQTIAGPSQKNSSGKKRGSNDSPRSDTTILTNEMN